MMTIPHGSDVYDIITVQSSVEGRNIDDMHALTRCITSNSNRHLWNMEFSMFRLRMSLLRYWVIISVRWILAVLVS